MMQSGLDVPRSRISNYDRSRRSCFREPHCCACGFSTYLHKCCGCTKYICEAHRLTYMNTIFCSSECIEYFALECEEANDRGGRPAPCLRSGRHRRIASPHVVEERPAKLARHVEGWTTEEPWQFVGEESAELLDEMECNPIRDQNIGRMRSRLLDKSSGTPSRRSADQQVRFEMGDCARPGESMTPEKVKACEEKIAKSRRVSFADVLNRLVLDTMNECVHQGTHGVVLPSEVLGYANSTRSDFISYCLDVGIRVMTFVLDLLFGILSALHVWAVVFGKQPELCGKRCACPIKGPNSGKASSRSEDNHCCRPCRPCAQNWSEPI